MKKTQMMINTLNMNEGWDVFYADGPLQIQVIDTPDFGPKKFSGDDEAALFVIARAVVDKNPRAIQALQQILDDTIPIDKSEWIRLCRLANEHFSYDLNSFIQELRIRVNIVKMSERLENSGLLPVGSEVMCNGEVDTILAHLPIGSEAYGQGYRYVLANNGTQSRGTVEPVNSTKKENS